MQSKISNASLYRVPAAARCSVLRSLIPNRLPQRPNTKCLPKPPRAVEKSEGSSRDIVADEGVPREVNQASHSKDQGSLVSLSKKAGVLDPELKERELRSGVVVSVKKDGVVVNIGAGFNGWLHKSYISFAPISEEDIEKMFSVGDKIKVMVYHISHDRKFVFLSTKGLEVNPGDMVKDPQMVYEKAEETAAAHRAELEAQAKAMAEAKAMLGAKEVDLNLKVNDLRTGVVKSVAGHRVYVDIGAGSIGLLHVRQISSVRISSEGIKKMFRVGDEIKVMVHRIYKDRQRFSLSTRSLEVNLGDMAKDPQLVYLTANEAAAAFVSNLETRKLAKGEVIWRPTVVDPNLKVDDLISGVVQSVAKCGVYVDIGAGSIGLLLKSQISSQRIYHEDDWWKMFSVGDEIKAMVHQIDKHRQSFSLSTRSLEVNPGDMVKNPQLVYLTANATAAAFISNPKARMEAQMELKVIPRGGLIWRPTVVDPNLKVHDLISGVVQSVANGGVYVDIGPGSIGLLLQQHISSDPVSEEDLGKMFSVGDEIKVVVHRISKNRHSVSLSTRSLEVNPGDMVKNPQLVYVTAKAAAAALQLRAKFEESKQTEKDLKVMPRGVDPNLKVHALRPGVVKSVVGDRVFVNIGAGSIGVLHISQISSDPICVEDLGKMFRVGQKIKVMVHKIGDNPWGCSLNTKNLEVNPGDMVKNPKLVYEKAKETAAAFRANVAAREQKEGV